MKTSAFLGLIIFTRPCASSLPRKMCLDSYARRTVPGLDDDPSALSDLSIASLFAVILPSRKDRASSPPEAIGRQAVRAHNGGRGYFPLPAAIRVSAGFPALHRETK
jgi:hypothetical protein